MIDTERREAARQFINRWRGKGKEDEDGRSYWIELLSNIFGVENVTERIDFEKKVVVDGHTKRIDVYIPETKVIIEQKSLNVPLDKKVRNSGEVDLTAFEQADRYNSKLIFDERARWIVTCNFAEIWIYDMNERQPKPSKIMLEELQTKYSLLDFLIKKEVQKISHEMEVSIKAGEIVGLIYNAFLEQYKIPKVKKNETEVEKEKREHKLKSLNIPLVPDSKQETMEQAYIPMDTIVEEDDGGEEAPEEEMYIPVLEEQSEEELSVKETVLGITRQMWLGNLSMEDMAQYLNRNLSVSTLKSPDLLLNWLSDIVDDDGKFLEEGKQVR